MSESSPVGSRWAIGPSVRASRSATRCPVTMPSAPTPIRPSTTRRPTGAPSRSAPCSSRWRPREPGRGRQRVRPLTPCPASASPRRMTTGPAKAQNESLLIALPLITPAPCRVNSNPARAITAPTRAHTGFFILQTPRCSTMGRPQLSGVSLIIRAVAENRIISAFNGRGRCPRLRDVPPPESDRVPKARQVQRSDQLEQVTPLRVSSAASGCSAGHPAHPRRRCPAAT